MLWTVDFRYKASTVSLGSSVLGELEGFTGPLVSLSTSDKRWVDETLEEQVVNRSNSESSEADSSDTS